jgi:hypothetical protein
VVTRELVQEQQWRATAGALGVQPDPSPVVMTVVTVPVVMAVMDSP